MATDDMFDSIVEGSFSPEERTSFSRIPITTPYTVEPVSPGRLELLECFGVLVESFDWMVKEETWGKITAEFSQRLLPGFGVERGGEIMVRSPRSFLTEAGLGTLEDGMEIMGEFQAFDVDAWYNVPFTEEATQDFDRYRVDAGLYLQIGAATLRSPYDEVCDILGNVLVPLNHGTPDIFRVLR